MKLTKRQATCYLHRCYQVLDDQEFVKAVKLKLGPDHGSYEPDGTICLNPTKAILPVCLHECLHALDVRDNDGESVTLYLEAEMTRLLSARQWTNLLHRLSEAMRK